MMKILLFDEDGQEKLKNAQIFIAGANGSGVYANEIFVERTRHACIQEGDDKGT